MVYIPILINHYYFMTKYYRFMSKSIFDSLEQSFLAGNKTALVPESDFLKMITEYNLKNGIQSN